MSHQTDQIILNATFGLTALGVKITTILDKVGHGTYGLQKIMSHQTDTIILNATYGLTALGVRITTIQDIVAHGTYGLSVIRNLLVNATYGLSALKTLLNAVIADTEDLQDNVDTMHDTDLPAVKSVVDDILADTADVQPKLGTPAADVSADIAAIKSVVDAITGVQLSTDWKGSFNWDTSAYTTNEQDISTLFSTNLAIDTRRKYTIKLDLTAVEADGSFDELYLAVKEKVDGTNYRAIDRKTITKAQIAATAEPGIIIVTFASSENIQITMQMKTALAGDATIYYSVVKEHLE